MTKVMTKQEEMRARLVELLCNVNCKGDDRREGGCGFRQNDRCNRIEKLDMCMVECIAEHLLAEGVIVLPCKVGTTVFVTDIIVGSIVECEVVMFDVDEDGAGGMEYRVPKEIPNIVSVGTLTTEIGKTVFFTREEALKMLEKEEKQNAKDADKIG